MFVLITNTPRDYAWGRSGAISALLGGDRTEALEAELWLGAHHGSPARVLAPPAVAAHGTLDEWIRAEPEAAGQPDGRLPFLFKILAAAQPLSIQAHPSTEQAREGFARENRAGIPADSPMRNYRDPFAKPELVVALEDGFEALSGFRPPVEVAEDLRALAAGLSGRASAADPGSSASPAVRAEAAAREAALIGAAARAEAAADTAAFLSSEIAAILGGDRADLLAAVQEAARVSPGLRVSDTLNRLADHYPGDPGILVGLYLNRATLARGEALYLPAGNVHAYLDGLGLELMTASDNVLRGGTTTKHIDVPELLGVLRFTAGPVPSLAAESPEPGVSVYRPAGAGFALYRLDLDAIGDAGVRLEFADPVIALQLAGEARLELAGERHGLHAGEAAYMIAPVSGLGIAGDGELWIAATA